MLRSGASSPAAAGSRRSACLQHPERSRRPLTSLTLRQRARAFRHHPTASEALLWQHLKAKQLGVQFRRQVVVGDFIADFLASSIRLIVEVDGGYHVRRVALDARRQRRLERAGFRVLRLPHDLVMRQTAGAVALVREAVEELA